MKRVDLTLNLDRGPQGAVILRVKEFIEYDYVILVDNINNNEVSIGIDEDVELKVFTPIPQIIHDLPVKCWFDECGLVIVELIGADNMN